ncbi:MAG: hypothetical protein ACE5NP_06775 [Anaerolineae bacterium]
MVDPEAPTIEVFVLEEGTYALVGKFAPGEVAHSQVLRSPGVTAPGAGFQVAVEEVFAE